MSKYPNVVIVGRTNVGKSTLFNCISSEVKSLTYDQEGVTRDFLQEIVSWDNRTFAWIDTGGVSLRRTQDPILESVRAQVMELLQGAAVVVFVCDGAVGLLPEDREVAKVIHKLGKKVLLVVNKMDTKIAQEHVYEFEKLGHPVILVSAGHRTGIGDLLEAIVSMLPQQTKMPEQEENRGCSVVLLGKPNVGKSSLMNLLVQRERSIVSSQPGTTREAIRESITFYKEDIELVDTPGVRRKRSIDEDLEQLMVRSTLRAVDQASVVLLLVDASEGTLSDQELQLAFYAFEKRKKAVILIFNKQDLTTDVSKQDLEMNLDKYDFLIKKLPSIAISCKTGSNIGKMLTLIHTIWERYNQQFSATELTTQFKELLKAKPLFCNGEALHIYGAEQLQSAPPTIVLRVNRPVWFGESQLKCLENAMRREYELIGVPIKWVVRARKQQ